MITFQYFDGCPNATVTLENLKAVCEELGIDKRDLDIVEIVDPEAAEALGFQGSPTILVEGRDLYTGTVPTGWSYACRVYTLDGKQTGVLPVSFLKESLRPGSP